MNRKRANRETLLAFLRDEVWGLPVETLSLLVQGVMNWPDMEWAAAFGRQPAPASRAGTIAVIPVHGMLEARASILDEYFGVTSLEAIRAAFRDAMGDPNVKAIVLDIDSPGGSVAGVTELANEIRAARGQGKAIVAHANTLAASAAYWIGSQAEELVVSPSGSVGSVGVVAVHQDFSRALDAEGITTTLIHSGEFKTEANPFEPLSDEAKAHLQERSDTHYQQFLADVAKGRGTTVENVRSTYGKGRLVLARQALASGVVDRIEPFDATLARMSKANGGAQPSVRAEAIEDDDPLPFRERIAALAREAEAVAAHAAERIEIRTRVNETRAERGESPRPLLPVNAIPALRTSRDAIDALLATVEPEGNAVTASQTGEPEGQAESTTNPPVSLPRVSREEFLARLARS